MRLFVLTLCASALSAQPTLVSYRDVSRALDSCRACHRQTKSAGYSMETYAGMMDGAFRGGAFRPAVIARDSAGSPLVAALEARSPSHRSPAPRDSIRLVRDWIDGGAKADDETERESRIDLDGVAVTSAAPSFWLSCRAPKSGQNIHLRLKVVDEATGQVVAYDWPISSRDVDGRWNQWRIEIPKNSMQLPGSVSVRLYVAATRKEDDVDGVIFLIEPSKTPDAELRRQKDFKTVAMPDPPPHQDLTFRYVLRTPSDVNLSVVPEGGGAVVFSRSDRDLPANQVLETPWKLTATPAVKTGKYTARFRFTPRTEGARQPDMAILFRITR
jgi:hypothetical protein